MSLKYNGEHIILAKNLRKNATPQENHLWYDFLCKHNIRFQRQKVIGEYIADFYSHKAKLVIEVDGSQHYTLNGKKKDEMRTEFLKNFGLQVIRFTNEQIEQHFYDVCRSIDIAIEQSLSIAASKENA